MNKKKKKGFTLIELLAIIVILAIVAVITVPIILNIIENSKRGAARNSAYGYKDAINKFYVSKASENSDYVMPDGTYTINSENGYLIGTGDIASNEPLAIQFSGNKPDGGSVELEKNVIKQGCIRFDEYVISITNGVVGEAVKGSCNGTSVVSDILSSHDLVINNKKISIVDRDRNHKISKGDSAKIGDDGFIIMSEPKDGKIMLLPEHNISIDGLQTTESSENDKVTFSMTSYWENNFATTSDPIDCVATYCNLYENEKSAYIYTNRKENNQFLNNLAEPIEKYKSHLTDIIGEGVIEEIRPLSEAEIFNNGEKNELFDDVDFWLGSLSIIFGDYNIWYVSDGYCSYEYSWNTEKKGIRPAIIIDISSVVAPSVVFDTQGGSEIQPINRELSSLLTSYPYSQKAGYMLEGWYTDKNYTERVTPSTMIDGSQIKYYAKWIEGNNNIVYTDADGDGNISVDDIVKLGTEEFNVATEPTNGKVTLIAKYSLGENFKQSEDNPVRITYSKDQYWMDLETDPNGYVLREPFKSEDPYHAYVYTRDIRNNLFYYMENYKAYLMSLGITNIIDVRPPRSSEAIVDSVTTEKYTYFVPTTRCYENGGVCNIYANSVYGAFVRAVIEIPIFEIN